MCGASAMAVRCGLDGVRFCAQGDSSLGEAILFQQFCDCVVRSAAGVIEGVKPAALFNFIPRSEEWLDKRSIMRGSDASWYGIPGVTGEREIRSLLATYGCELPSYGVKLATLSRYSDRLALLAYREDMLSQVLADADVRAFLASYGYDLTSVDSVISCLRRRMTAFYGAGCGRRPKREFPHEVGVLLGYPLEDVQGFLTGAEATVRGSWKAYGDAGAARARFHRLAKHEARCRARYYQEGASFGELFSPGPLDLSYKAAG